MSRLNPANEQRLRDAVVSLSLANLCLLRVWGALLNPANHYFLREANHYFLRAAPGWAGYFLAPALTVGLGAAFFALAQRARQPGHPWLRRFAPWGLLAVATVALNGLRQHVDWLSLNALATTWGGRFSSLLLVAVIGTALASHRRRAQVVRALQVVLLALSPFVLVTFVQAAAEAWTFRAAGDRSAFADKPNAPPLPARPEGQRVVFLVFDGLDQHLLFSERPPTLSLPAFDRLRAEAAVATQAYPVHHSTAVSLPSLITGRHVLKVERRAADELFLWMDEAGDGVPWSEEDNVFRRTRALGFNGALLGWYHPYCRVLARDVTTCAWFPYVPDPDPSPAVAAGRQLALLVETVPLAARYDVLGRVGLGPLREPDAPSWFLRQYRALHARALAAVRDPGLGLVFVHYPVPHWPNVYDRFTGRFQTDGRGEYADNLALTDRTLRDVRDALGAAGLEERTALLLTSDHWHRRPGWRERGEFIPVIGTPEHRVPLLLRLPGGGDSTSMDRPVMNILAQGLALAVLRGEVMTHAQAAAWLQERALPAAPSAPLSSAGH